MTHRRSWRKSTYSNDTIDSACVEVSLAQDALVRDSKASAAATLEFSLPAWRAFLVRVGQ